MKRPLAVLLVGMGIVGLATFVGRRGANERFKTAAEAVDADCRAFRSQPRNREANICRFDQYSLRVAPLFAESKELITSAESAAARGDKDAAVRNLDRVVANIDDLDREAIPMSMLASSMLVELVLDLGERHRELDMVGLLAHVELAAHPFARQRLHRRWVLVHWNDRAGDDLERRSTSELADALEKEPATFDAMDEALVARHDVNECSTIAREAHGDLSMAEILCIKFGAYLKIRARLDEARHHGLSSAKR